MEKSIRISCFKEYLEFLSKAYSDVDSDKEIYSQIKECDYNNFICLPNQFYHIVDIRTSPSKIIYVSPNVASILGYSPDEIDLEFFYNITHPDDRDVIFEATTRLVDIQKKLQLKPLEYFGHLNYRMQKKDGSYIRIERKTSNLINDANNYMVFSIQIYTDISHLTKTNRIKLFWTGPDNKAIDFSENTLLKSNELVSKREKEIISFIAKGNSSKEIAEILNISRNTVDTHRRKIIRKLGLKNSTELVLFSYEKGFI